MDITKYAILKKLAGGGGGGSGHEVEDALVTGTLTEYTNDRVTKIKHSCFHSCNSLTSVSLPNIADVSNSCFSTCAKLVTVNVPSAKSIDDNGFAQCSSLVRVKFPNVKTANTYALRNCSKLEEADFPTITFLRASVFENDSQLKAVIIRTGSVCTLGNIYNFNNTPISSGTGYIYVPAVLIDSYKTATNWTTYADQFRALESYTVDGTTTGELDPTKVNA